MPVISSIWKVETGGWNVELVIDYLWSSGIACAKGDLVPQHKQKKTRKEKTQKTEKKTPQLVDFFFSGMR